MKTLKYILVICLLFVTFVLLKLPSTSDTDLKSLQQIEEFESIPDHDYRSMAIRLWDKGFQEEAISSLKIIIDQNLPDSAAAQQQYDEWLEEIAKRNSALGKVKAFGMAFVTGEVKSFEELAGSSLADFFIYGDVRDLTRELVFSDNSDKLIITLSSVGLLTSIFPPAEPASSLLKTAYKTGSLTGEMRSLLLRTLGPLRRGISNLSVSQLKNVMASIKPIWDMAKNSSSWQHFSVFLKQCKNMKQVKFINKIITKPGNGEKLAAILTSLRKMPKASSDALGFIRNYGQQGMDSLYSVLRKGPAGLQFLVKNPSLYAKLGKNSTKAAQLAAGTLNQKWQKLLSQYGQKAVILRYSLIFLCIALAISILLFKNYKNYKKAPNSDNVKSNKITTPVIALTILTFSILILSMSNSSDTTFSLGQAATAGSFSSISIILLTIFLAMQAWCILKTKAEVESIKKINDNKAKLSLLDNAEFYFDLPIYAGLAGTVFSFIFLAMDPGGSRILAYVTTVSGISISAFLRGMWLMPLKKDLLQQGVSS